VAKRPCVVAGCPVLGDTTRCPAHTRETDKAQGTRRERGYDLAFDPLRARAVAGPSTRPERTRPGRSSVAYREGRMGGTDATLGVPTSHGGRTPGGCDVRTDQFPPPPAARPG
jgi:hypothetical protein